MNLDFLAAKKGEKTIRSLDTYCRLLLQKKFTIRLNNIVLSAGAASDIYLIEITNQQEKTNTEDRGEKLTGTDIQIKPHLKVKYSKAVVKRLTRLVIRL